MSMLVSFVLSFFPRDVLDEILNLIGSVSEGFPSYSWSQYNLMYQEYLCENLTLSYRLLLATGTNFQRKYVPLLVLVPLIIH